MKYLFLIVSSSILFIQELRGAGCIMQIHKMMKNDMKNDHLWLGILQKTPTDRFTRVRILSFCDGCQRARTHYTGRKSFCPLFNYIYVIFAIERADFNEKFENLECKGFPPKKMKMFLTEILLYQFLLCKHCTLASCMRYLFAKLQSSVDSSYSVGKLDVFEHAVFKCKISFFVLAVDGLDSWSRRQIIDIV